MIVAVVSTSSPMASVAIFSGDVLISEASEFAPMRASGAVFKLLETCLADTSTKDIDVWVADVGPGSFTGVKVGVTIIKTIAFALGRKVAGVTSFDLIGEGDVAVPSRKNMHLLRTVGGVYEVASDDPRVLAATRYDYSGGVYPLAKSARLDGLELTEPELLLPNYVLEPNISVPKGTRT
jgi:tRNA threonylcarbamoyl adenosine modification protein YeaZ